MRTVDPRRGPDAPSGPDPTRPDDDDESLPPPGTGGRPSLRRAVAVFGNRHYRYLWASSTVSFTGMQMQQIARALLAWQLTESFGWVGAIMLAFGLPMLAFSLIGGAVADRVEKRNLSLLTQGVMGLLGLVTATLIVTDLINIQILFITGLIQGTAFAFGMPARMPLMAEAVGPRDLGSAVALNAASMNGTRLVGPAVAGMLIAAWGIGTAYFVQAGFYIVATLLLLGVPTGLRAMSEDREAALSGGMPGTEPGIRGRMGGGMPGMNGRRPPDGMLKEIGNGLRYVATHPSLRLLIAMMFVTMLFAMPHVMLLAGFVQRDLGQSEAAYGFLQSVSGAGALVGSLAIAALVDFDRKPLLQWIVGLLSGVGLVMLALGSMQFGYPAALVATAFLGLTLTAYQTINMTIIMDVTDSQYYGRVMSINMLTFSAMPIMAAPLGVVADMIGAGNLFILQGAAVAGFMVFVALVNPKFTFRRHVTENSGPRRPIPGGGGFAPTGPGGPMAADPGVSSPLSAGRDPDHS